MVIPKHLVNRTFIKERLMTDLSIIPFGGVRENGKTCMPSQLMTRFLYWTQD